MKTALRIGIFAFFLFGFATPAFADECDDINELANAWNEVSNLVAEYGDDLDDEELKALDEAVETLAEATGLLSGFLAESGNAEAVALSKELDTKFELLMNADASNVVKRLDTFVDTLDKVTDLCTKL